MSSERTRALSHESQPAYLFHQPCEDHILGSIFTPSVPYLGTQDVHETTLSGELQAGDHELMTTLAAIHSVDKDDSAIAEINHSMNDCEKETDTHEKRMQLWEMLPEKLENKCRKRTKSAHPMY